MTNDNDALGDDSKRRRILDAIPHRPPFLFIDEILEQSERKILCSYRFKGDEFFFQGHYPGSPLVPGVILCESAMQAGAILLTDYFRGDAENGSCSPKVPVVGRMNEVKFKRIVRPGETVLLDVELKEKMKSAYFLTAKITCDGNLVLRFDFACAATDRPKSDA